MPEQVRWGADWLKGNLADSATKEANCTLNISMNAAITAREGILDLALVRLHMSTVSRLGILQLIQTLKHWSEPN